MRIALVVNRSAGTFRRLPLEPTVEAVAEAMRRAGHDVAVKICASRDLADVLSTLAGDDGTDAVVAGGGDGTILTAILAGLGRGKILAVLPLGTMNLFARDLGLPLDPVKAADLVARGHPAEIDLAEVNGLPFVVWASLGLHPFIVHQRDKLQKKGGLNKWPAFALAALRVFRRYPLVSVTLSLRGKVMTVTTPALVITNNAWKAQIVPPTRESLDQGEMEVHVVKVTSRLGLAWLALAALFGFWRAGRLLETFRADEVRVTSRKRRQMVSLDGEVTVLRSPLVFRSRPKVLTILMPATDQEP
jgi:Sphingosine kinase and enzymes related to eukaryotic diacylglycerol kinase